MKRSQIAAGDACLYLALQWEKTAAHRDSVSGKLLPLKPRRMLFDMAAGARACAAELYARGGLFLKDIGKRQNMQLAAFTSKGRT